MTHSTPQSNGSGAAACIGASSKLAGALGTAAQPGDVQLAAAG